MIPMSDKSPISRREALLAATAVTSIAMTGIANADTPGSGPANDDAFPIPARTRAIPDSADGFEENNQPQTSVTLSVTLTDGQIVQLKATQVVVDYGNDGKLLVKSTGVMPMSAARRI